MTSAGITRWTSSSITCVNVPLKFILFLTDQNV
jgi:hypothetical protein